MNGEAWVRVGSWSVHHQVGCDHLIPCICRSFELRNARQGIPRSYPTAPALAHTLYSLAGCPFSPLTEMPINSSRFEIAVLESSSNKSDVDRIVVP